MYKLTICTGWSPKGFDQYGKYFLASFDRYAAKDIRLLCYVEDKAIVVPDRAELVDLGRGALAFRETNRNNPERTGRAPTKQWKESERAAGYSFRWDAVKFAPQGYIPLDAARRADTKLLAWFDADVVFTAPFSAATIAGLLPEGKHIAYLGRPPKHSEIGFQLYRLSGAFPHLFAFHDLYETGHVFKLAETHSAYVFDAAREISGVPAHNLTPNGKGNVWLSSPLTRFSVHLKGNRKNRAKDIAPK